MNQLWTVKGFQKRFFFWEMLHLYNFIVWSIYKGKGGGGEGKGGRRLQCDSKLVDRLANLIFIIFSQDFFPKTKKFSCTLLLYFSTQMASLTVDSISLLEASAARFLDTNLFCVFEIFCCMEVVITCVSSRHSQKCVTLLKLMTELILKKKTC